MDCLTPERTCPVSACAERYRIYLFSDELISTKIIARNMGTGKEVFIEKTPEAQAIGSSMKSRVNFSFADFNNFLLSDSDFEFECVRSTANGFIPVQIYLGAESSVDILAESMIVHFIPCYETNDTLTTPVNPIIFKSVNAD